MSTTTQPKAPVHTTDDSSAGVSKHARMSRWGKRAGVAAFLFFFFKGLAWLIVPALIAVWSTT